MRLFSDLVRDGRAARRLTLEQLAAEAGFHATHLSLVERGGEGGRLMRTPPAKDRQVPGGA